MKLKRTERLVAAGTMPLRAPGGAVLDAVPVYKIVPAESTSNGVTLEKGERLVPVGVSERKITAEERYKALISGEMPPKSCATALYIKEPYDGKNAATELTEGEKRVLNPLVAELLKTFSEQMQEREQAERRKGGGQ